jgi:hypothetical protein
MSYLTNRRAFLKWIAAILIGTSLLLTWLFTGIVFSHSDEESKSSFFLKKYPTFKIKFYDIDDSDSDYLPFSKLLPEERDAVTEYCKYRFAVASNEISKIEACRQHNETVRQLKAIRKSAP